MHACGDMAAKVRRASVSNENKRFAVLIYISLVGVGLVFFASQRLDSLATWKRVVLTAASPRVGSAPIIDDGPVVSGQPCLRQCAQKPACSATTATDSERRSCFLDCRRQCKADTLEQSGHSTSFFRDAIESVIVSSAEQRHPVADEETPGADGENDPVQPYSYFKDVIGADKVKFVALLKAISEVFDSSKLDYMIFGGTVISHCRHAGTMMPFDDDLDLLFARKDVGAFQSGVDTWNAAHSSSTFGKLTVISDLDGGATSALGNVLKVYWEKTPAAGWTKWHYPYIDLWTYELRFFDRSSADRYTEENKHCQGSFMYEGTEHFDCIPDARTGKDWCYIDADYNDEKGWGYCQPRVIDQREDPAGELPPRQPWNIMWPGAQVFVKQTKTWKGYVYPHEYLFPTQPIVFEGLTLRGPKELGAYLQWEYGNDWRTVCKIGDWDHKIETFKRRPDGSRGFPAGIETDIGCVDLAKLHPTWKFSLGSALEQQCPTTLVSTSDQVRALTATKACSSGDTSRRATARALLRSFHAFMKEFEIEYWITYGTALGQAVWSGGIPYDTDVDVAMKLSDAKQFAALLSKPNASRLLKSAFNAKLVLQPDWQKPHWKERKYYREEGVNFVAPVARYYDLDGDTHLDIWGEPTHGDMPSVVPDGYIAQQHENYDYIPRPLDWVYPLRECDFDGVTVTCQRQQALALRFEYGHDFRTPHKTCVDGQWLETGKCIGKCGTEKRYNGRDWCWTNRNRNQWKYCTRKFEAVLEEMDRVRQTKKITPCMIPCGTEAKWKGKDWCYTSETTWDYCSVPTHTETPGVRSTADSTGALPCKTKCGVEAKRNGQDWCYTNLGAEPYSWRYCDVTKETLQESVRLQGLKTMDSARKAAARTTTDAPPMKFQVFIPQYTTECNSGLDCSKQWRSLVPGASRMNWVEDTPHQMNLHNTFLLGKEALDTLGIPFHLDSGTALGAVREGTFIAHDPDIDVGVFQWDLVRSSIAEITTAFRANGFSMQHVWKYNEDIITELQFLHRKYNVQFDLIVQGVQSHKDLVLDTDGLNKVHKTLLDGASDVMLTYAFGPPCKKRFGTDTCGYWMVPFAPQTLLFRGIRVLVPPLSYYLAQYGSGFAIKRKFSYQEGLKGGYKNFCKLTHIAPWKPQAPPIFGAKLYLAKLDHDNWLHQVQKIRQYRYTSEYPGNGAERLDFILDQKETEKEKATAVDGKQTQTTTAAVYDGVPSLE